MRGLRDGKSQPGWPRPAVGSFMPRELYDRRVMKTYYLMYVSVDRDSARGPHCVLLHTVIVEFIGAARAPRYGRKILREPFSSPPPPPCRRSFLFSLL